MWRITKMKTIALVLTIAVATSMTLPAAVGDIVASASSSQTWMDTVTCTQTVIQIGQDTKPERLAYSGWTWFLDGRTSGTVRITDNDVEIASFAGEGVYEWVPSVPDVHNVKLIISGGPTYEQVYLVEGPKVTIARGTDPAVNGGFSCEITSTVPGATIYFTTDGTEPTTESRVYTGPFAINPAMVTAVKSFCVAAGWPRSHTAMKLFMPAENMEIVSKSDSAQTFLDTRAGKGVALEARESEPIVWSGLWSADSDADVSVTVNSSPFVSGKGEGLEMWTPTVAGLYTFQHTTAGSSEALAATFNVAAKDIALAQVVVDCCDVTYSGSAFTPVIQSATWGGKTLVEGTDYTLAYSGNVNVGKATITLTGINLFNGTYTTNFTIKPKTLASAMVGAVGNVTYTGSAQKPEPTVTDSARGVTLVKGTDYTLSWGANTAAGSGSVTVTGKGNYTGSITKNFTIAKAEVTQPTIAGKSYTGGLLKADVSATARYTVMNDGGVNAGNYPVTLTLTDAANYRWNGGDSNPLNLTFTITKAANSWLTQPSINGWTYGQVANVPNMGAAKFGTASVTYSATPQNAGSYTATFTVPGTANYSGLTKSVPFTIAKATYDMSGASWNYAGAFGYDGGVKTVLVSGLPSGVTVSAYVGNTATAPGSYTAHAMLAYDAANYNAPSIADLQWSIKSSEGSKLEEIFDDLPAEIAPDGEGGWTVTITNDFDSADLPIEIPDNLGHVTIDLGGHDLIGGDGVAGDADGGDGKPAIVIVSGSGDGDATRLTLVTTGGDSLVKGGNGGAGNPGGNGASAIEVADGAKAGVKIDVGAGVTVRGGDGGASETGRGGDGGDGIDGDVGVNDGTIIGGNGGDSVSGDGGNGGDGVDGSVDVNNGDITGGDGGASETGDGGDGGMGVTGDVGTNDGTIGGGAGVDSAQGEDGDDGISVGGTVGGGTGTIAKIKVEMPDIPSAEYTGEPVTPDVPKSSLWTVDAPRGVVLPGTYSVTLTLTDPQNYRWAERDGAAVLVDFTIIAPPPRIQTEGGGKPGRENAASTTATYDGRGHGISVVVTYPPTGAVVRYARTKAGPFAAARPLWTNSVDGAETWYTVTAEGFDPVTNMATVTVAPKSLSATMVTGKRLVEDAKGRVSAQLTLSDVPPCELTKADWEYVSWEWRASGGGTATVRGKRNYAGTISVDVPNEMVVVFDAVYGDAAGVRTATTQTPGRPYVLPPQNPQYRGYDFVGWFTSRDGGEQITPQSVATLRDPDVVYAHWRIRSFRTTFELNGGEGSFEPLTFDYGSVYGALPVPSRAGYLFDGWWTTPGFEKGTMASEDDVVPARDATLYAKWLRRKLWYTDAVFHLESAAVYDGYLMDDDDVVAGTIQVKVGKPNAMTGICKVTATVLVAGEKKLSVKGTTFDGTMKATAKDGRELDLRLGAGSLSGTFDGYALDGARNVFAARDADSKLLSAQVLKQWQGTYTVAWHEDSGWNGLSLVVGNKGKTKVSGTLSDGTRVSANSQLLVGERECAVAVSWTKKHASVACLVWLCEDGTAECANLPGGAVAHIANARTGAYLKEGATFRVDAAELQSKIPGIEVDLLPNGLPVRMQGVKFDIDRAGRVRMSRGEATLDLSNAGTNPAGLKLSYTIKKAVFKGSFAVYQLTDGRLKKFTAKVTGVVVGGVGYGSAAIRGVGAVPITIQ